MIPGLTPAACRGSGHTVGAPPVPTLPLQQPAGQDLVACPAPGSSGAPAAFCRWSWAPSLALRAGLGGCSSWDQDRGKTTSCPLQKHAGLDCTRLGLHPKSLPWDQGNLSALPPLPGISSRLVPSSCSFSWSFWALLLPTSLGSCPCQGGCGNSGVVVSLLRGRERFPPPQPGLLGTGHFKGDWLCSSMRTGAGRRRSRWFFHRACQVETT